MVYAILAVGVALVSISLWEIKRLRDESGRELENLRLIKKEIYQAKKDVEKLLVELNKASERAVHELVQKIEDYRTNLPMPETAALEEAAALTPAEEDELKGQIAIEFSGVEPYHIPEKHLLVYQLAEEGLSPSEIARKTKMGKGEVALILNLRSVQKNVQILQ